MSVQYRSHRISALGVEHAGQTITLAGWIARKRALGSVLFLELRDAGEHLQCVIEATSGAFASLTEARVESVVSLTGVLAPRPSGTEHADVPRGALELRVSEAEVLSAADALPFPISSEQEPPEELRLRHRYLDLRRSRMRRNVVLRARLMSRLRELLGEQGFFEVTTPILTASSPEGARDFLVPSRLHPGRFYALPQAPQIFKQLLMVAGFDRYFQIAPCFRDEDARRDRSPGEFYQLDLELAFADQSEIFSVIEPVIRQVFNELGAFPVADGLFPQITYRDALARFGTDKPDLRNPLELRDVTSWHGQPGVAARALVAPAAASRSRKFFEQLAQTAREHGAASLSYVALADPPKGPLMRGRAGDLQELVRSCGAAPGDAILVVAAAGSRLNAAASALRTKAAELLELVQSESYRFAWIVDFPMYERDAGGKLQFLHNPFSMPQGGMAALAGDPEAVLAYQYDLVCNGVELSSGAIRNHKPEIMLRAFELCGYSAADVEGRFGAMLSAFRFGAPPHGGLAPGIDRMAMLLADEANLREVVAFPLTQSAEDLLLGAPSHVTGPQLAELGLTIRSPSRAV